MRARTGSGKTAAFTIPVIQRILNMKNTSTHQSIRALILSPSKELCGQVSTDQRPSKLGAVMQMIGYHQVDSIMILVS